MGMKHHPHNMDSKAAKHNAENEKPNEKTCSFLPGGVGKKKYVVGRHPPPCPGDVMDTALEDATIIVNEFYSQGIEGKKRNRFVQQNSNITMFESFGTSIIIKQNRDLQSRPGITGAALWDSSLILAKYLEGKGRKRLGLTSESVCLELGAGCGLLGISLSKGLGVKHVDITDQEDMLPLLGPKTHVAICMEMREVSVMEEFLSLALCYFDLDQVPLEDMNDEYKSEAVFIFILKRKTDVAAWLRNSSAHQL